jgi:signal transduction histidine kinase
MTPGADKWGGELPGLQRVAALIGDDAGIDEILAATAAEARTLTGAECAAVVRHDTGAVTVWPPETRWVPGDGDVSVEIRVGQQLLGAVSVHAEEPFPPGIEQRLRGLAGLTAAALSREDLHRLTGEQAALRRVAMLVAGGAAPAETFDAVVEGIGRLLGVGSVALVRYDGSDQAVVLAGWGRLWEAVPRGARLALGGDNVVTRVARTGESVRIDYVADSASGAIATRARRVDTRAAVGGPIFMGGELWGVMVAAALGDEAIPDRTELRLEQFTTLVATAISNSEARLELARLADEQAALRRVATLVAEETPPADLFAKVAEEATGVIPGEVEAAIHRYDPDGSATVVATCGSPPPHGIWLGERIPLAGSSVIARVFREQRPVRVDFYPATEGAVAERAQRHGIRSAFGSPIVVHGRLWGAMIVANHDEDPFPADIERQVRPFTDLLATSIANAQARDERRRLADEQAALRRVATMVARSVEPTELFSAVTEEVGRLLDADLGGMIRFLDDDMITPVATWAADGQHPPVEGTWSLQGDRLATAIAGTGLPKREDDWAAAEGPIAAFIREHMGVRSSVGSPVLVEGCVWGALFVHSTSNVVMPPDTEQRLVNFSELVATAIANIEARADLAASRVRLVAAADDERRRVVRDLHDGAQQRLVHTILTLKLAQRTFDDDPDGTKELLADALRQAEDGNAELRELAHGLLPSVLSGGGLAAGVDSLVARMDLPVDVDVTTTRMAPEIEANAYFIVAEALTNVVKHARATRAGVTAVVRGELLLVEIRDDGIGGGDPEGSGLLGIADRAAALGGRLRLESPPGAGTLLVAELPLA